MICEVRQSVSNEVSVNIFVNIKVNLYIVCAHTYANVCGHTKCLKLMSVSLIKTKILILERSKIVFEIDCGNDCKIILDKF